MVDLRRAANRKLDDQVISFGAFRLFTAERRLEKNGVPVRLGGRALEILLALAEHAPEIVDKNDLIARVWPGVRVEEVSLRFHIGTLRKALSDGQSKSNYIINVSGRGYALAVPTSAGSRITEENTKSLPPRLMRMVGRNPHAAEIASKLISQRFVTIVGPGGIGKTTVAISVAHDMLSNFEGIVVFFDLGPLGHPSLVPGLIASTLGLPVNVDNPVPAVLSYLKDKRLLLIFDSCEHLIEPVAAIAESIFRQATHVHILATSREPLRIEGEQVYRLPPLDYPPQDLRLTAHDALRFPAVQLFMERVAALGGRFELSDADAPLVGDLCRKLDGIALALELAAASVDTYGIQETAALLENQFKLLWHGRRTALPRHQTLSATLDWSYKLLSEFERFVLYQLSIFVGPFSLDAALFVAAANLTRPESTVQAVGNLVAKSLISTSVGLAGTRYRLLDTTRAYVRTKVIADGERNAIAQRHAHYYYGLLERGGVGSLTQLSPEDLESYREHLDNVRIALEWSFSPEGDQRLGTALAAASAPLFLGLSLLTECRTWAERAIAAFDEADRDTLRELTLQAALSISMMFTIGNTDQVSRAMIRGLQLAEQLHDGYLELRLLGHLNMFNHRIANFDAALAFARRAALTAKRLADPSAEAVANWMLCVSLHLIGNQASAQAHCEVVLVQPAALRRTNRVHFGREHRIRALSAMARTLWLRGLPDQAVTMGQYAISEAEKFGQSIFLCLSLVYTGAIFFWTGDWDAAGSTVERLISVAEEYSLLPYHADGLALKGELSIRLGNMEMGINLIRDWLNKPARERSEIQTTVYITYLAEALAMNGDLDEAQAAIDQGLALAERLGDWYYLPEMLRVKGRILGSLSQSDQKEVERFFLDSLRLARRQSALSWELRTAVTLAEFYRKYGQFEKARHVLSPVVSQFMEGNGTNDVKAAKRLLEELGSTVA